MATATKDLEYTISYRRPDKLVDSIHVKNLASVGGHLAHLAEDYETLWVRQNPGGAIVLVYDARGSLRRP